MVHGKQESESDAPSPSSLTLTTRVKRRPCSSRASLQRLSTASCLAQILLLDFISSRLSSPAALLSVWSITIRLAHVISVLDPRKWIHSAFWSAWSASQSIVILRLLAWIICELLGPPLCPRSSRNLD